MKHQLNISDLEGFQSETVLASSSKGKRLVIQSFLVDGELTSFFQTKVRTGKSGWDDIWETKCQTKLLNIAIANYNSL